MNVNVWDVNQHVQELIRARRRVDSRALADPETPLDALVAEPAG
jgi:3-phenylpropionate/trans-cinnamate dioxygenase ferredoxin reductase component